MRRVVVGKLLILTLWGLYLAVGLSQPSENGGPGHTITSISRCLHGRLSSDAASGGHPALETMPVPPLSWPATLDRCPALGTPSARPHQIGELNELSRIDIRYRPI